MYLEAAVKGSYKSLSKTFHINKNYRKKKRINKSQKSKLKIVYLFF